MIDSLIIARAAPGGELTNTNSSAAERSSCDGEESSPPRRLDGLAAAQPLFRNVGSHEIRIAVVDDDPDYLELVLRTLQRGSYQADGYVDPAVFLETVPSSDYDLVITDYRMPRISGLEVVRRLHAIRPALPCLLMSSDLPLHEADLDSLLGVGATIQKSYSLPTLCDRVRALLSRGRDA